MFINRHGTGVKTLAPNGIMSSAKFGDGVTITGLNRFVECYGTGVSLVLPQKIRREIEKVLNKTEKQAWIAA